MQSPRRVTCGGKMVDSTVVSVDLPPKPPSTTEFGSAPSVPPIETALFSQQQLIDSNCNLGEHLNDLEGLDFDFDFVLDDFSFTPADFEDHLPDPAKLDETDSFKIEPELDPNFDRFDFRTNLAPYQVLLKSASSDLRHHSGDGDFSGDHGSLGSGVLNSASPVLESNQISGYLNLSSPESDGSNREISENSVGDVKEVNCPSPDTQGSGNCKSHVSEESNDCAARPVSSSPNLKSNPIRNVFVDNEIKSEDSSNCNAPSSLLKKKKERDDCYGESRIAKYKKSNSNAENDDYSGLSEEEEKRNARLMRNRESAQLSRQRKKHYVEELEDKVRMMHSTIQDLNVKISFFMAENVTLRQQMGSGGGMAAPPPQMAPPPPGMYSHPAMMYPWVPYTPPYVMKPQGSQIPLVPIPRLKPQPAQSQKVSKKVESKKNEGQKSKKVASVSFLGLLLFIMLFGGLVPIINVKYGGVRQALTGGESYVGDGYYEKHNGRLLMVNETANGEKFSSRGDFSRDNSSVNRCQRGNGCGGEPNADEFSHVGNGTEPLIASLYVPRNDKLVKIDGNLIIHSVLASEKAMASNTEVDGETGLAVPVGLVSAIPVPGVGRSGIRHPHLRALGPNTEDRENLKSTATDGSLHQWFREGLAGPMLSSGMCTEVFQFDISQASVSGVVIPASTQKNISEEQAQNSTHLNKGRNRRFLFDHPIPLPESHHNTSEEHRQRNSRKDNLDGNNLTSSMVVSVLVDPRETGDSDVDGVMGKNSISRIFVVVLIDSVKYVTYSCMLPFLGSASHLVTN
ncbi:bZIP transcription factor 17-like [Primulina eburnea]|uniref:bZIP transcription factor 17-like n=1 Tax=Primulina eburnea TaxID=1245227 RepID=UPI003C6C60CA